MSLTRAVRREARPARSGLLRQHLEAGGGAEDEEQEQSGAGHRDEEEDGDEGGGGGVLVALFLAVLTHRPRLVFMRSPVGSVQSEAAQLMVYSWL